jgi:hypothetical protein
MRKIFLNLLSLISFLVLIAMPCNIKADDMGITIQNPLEAAEFEVILDNIIGFIFNIAIVLAPLMIIIAGFLFVTAGGDLNQINRAKSIIVWTSVGFLIILLSRGIMGIIKNILGVR